MTQLLAVTNSHLRAPKSLAIGLKKAGLDEFYAIGLMRGIFKFLVDSIRWSEPLPLIAGSLLPDRGTVTLTASARTTR